MKNAISSIIFVIGVIIVSHSHAKQPHYNLYYADVKAGDFSYDCLYLALSKRVESDKNVNQSEQMIEYCFRPSSKEEEVVSHGYPTESVFTFNQLKEKNITSEDLLQWSSSIDLIERYEHFLVINESSSFERYYNCTTPWFGSFCQYRFDLNQSFQIIVNKRFHFQQTASATAYITCYVHLNCNREPSPLCLDWREICDGKIDCLDSGEDEKHCLELEMNQCNENEYQCRNGMCINEAFLFDEYITVSAPECLDGSDEPMHRIPLLFATVAGFNFEELTCRYPEHFPCGDGTCIKTRTPTFSGFCYNKRDRVFGYSSNWDNADYPWYSRCFKMLMCASKTFRYLNYDLYCRNLCENRTTCQNQTVQLCPSIIIAPNFPVWDSHVRYGYFSNQAYNMSYEGEPHLICYDKTHCPFIKPTFTMENYTCLHVRSLDPSKRREHVSEFVSCQNLNESGNETHCRHSNMLRCSGTNKCIPARRIMDDVVDCLGEFDESLAANSCALNDKYRFRCTSENKCLSPMSINDGIRQCIDGEDEPIYDTVLTNIHQILFSALCDIWTDIFPSTNETDETHCEEWPCSNPYTRCNEAWNCLRGDDEVNCPSRFHCPVDHHPCFFPINQTMGCLHLSRAENGIVDCLGATDERSYCRSKYSMDYFNSYRCWNQSNCVEVANRCSRCDPVDNVDQLCEQSDEDTISYLESANNVFFYSKYPFSPRYSPSFPPIQYQSSTGEYTEQETTEESEENPSDYQMDERYMWLCHRGVLIFVRANETAQCLCPPSYYGRFCQYQNQRVSLTIRLRKQNSDKLDVVGIVVTLVDHTDIVHSHEQFTFIPVLHCNMKFNLYLLYRNRPKNISLNYTIHVDAYDRVNLIYLTSWTLKVPFPFMPVNRMSAQLIIPPQPDCHLLCDHQYVASLKESDIVTCQCNMNRSKMIENIRNKCNCSSDSICVGFVNHRSICLCPLDKAGPRCYLRSICQTKSCAHGGICIPNDIRNSSVDFQCICPEDYSGKRCQTRDVRIDISFSNVEVNQSLLLHFITITKEDLFVSGDEPTPSRTTLFKKIPIFSNTITVNMSHPFHLVFAEMTKIYYLIVLHHNYTSSVVYSTQIAPSQRCPHIRKFFNQSMLQLPVLHRAKYYHIPCKKHSDLLCFHDEEVFMCLCTEERFANCFHFDFNMTYDCRGENNCQNGGECYRDHPICPKMIMCVCPECYYGSQCQFPTKYTGLSLDIILGYQINSYLSITKQFLSIKISIALATMMLFAVLIGGSLSTMTFRVKTCREMGCGLYLLTTSIMSIIVIVIFNLKLWFLILSQMKKITSKNFLLFNCITIEYLLRSLLAMIDWLHACVAVERVLVGYLGVNFNKTKSKRAAKLLIIIVIVFTAISLLHDPIHRRPFEDIDEQRTWCLVRFSSSADIYNTFINIFHFTVPFSLNVLSAIGVIICTAKQRLTVKTQQSFIQQLKEQLYRHKHLLLSSTFVVILALPRLIISFLPNCMKSPHEYQLYLVGYFISFIPPLLIFFIFVLTSETYTKECKALIRRKWTAFQRRFKRN